MADGEGLRERLGEIVRESAVNQARVYRDVSGLLDRLASRKVRTAEFAREAVDIYLGALGNAASTGVTLASEAVHAGIRGVGIAAAVAAQAAEAAEHEVSATSVPPPARPGKTAARRTSAAVP
jgi:hypothetical protein